MRGRAPNPWIYLVELDHPHDADGPCRQKRPRHARREQEGRDKRRETVADVDEEPKRRLIRIAGEQSPSTRCVNLANACHEDLCLLRLHRDEKAGRVGDAVYPPCSPPRVDKGVRAPN